MKSLCNNQKEPRMNFFIIKAMNFFIIKAMNFFNEHPCICSINSFF